MNRWLVLRVAFLSVLILVGCGSSPAGSKSAGTPAIAQTPTATATPLPTATPDRDPFQVNFLQHYQTIPCPATQTPTNLCYTLEDDASASSLGMVSFNGTDILYELQGGTNCGPAERTGALMLAEGDTITIHAMGPYCVPGYAVSFNFTVTGGTGQYRHASGAGTIAVGPAAATTAREFWSGTISS